MTRGKSMMGLGLVTAVASSLCCITPLIAILAGSSGLATTFRWVEPLRPWLIGFTLAALGFAWYQVLKVRSVADCDCEDDVVSFWNGRPFLGFVTVFAALMLSFPLYAHVFYPERDYVEISESENEIRLVDVAVDGMTCSGCEEHVEHAVGQLEGILEIKASFEDANALVKYDPSTTDIGAIDKAISSTGYLVKGHQFLDIKNKK